MSGRRTPRDFLVKPDQFGRREHALWVPVPDDRAEPFRMAAAFFQHHFPHGVIGAQGNIDAFIREITRPGFNGAVDIKNIQRMA